METGFEKDEQSSHHRWEDDMHACRCPEKTPCRNPVPCPCGSPLEVRASTH